MKKYVYGAFFIAGIVVGGVFFFNPPRTHNLSSATLALTFHFPEGYELTDGAPYKLFWSIEGPDGVLSSPEIDKHFDPRANPYALVFTPSSAERALVLEARLYYCHKVSRMCFQGDFKTRVPIEGKAFPRAWVWEIEPKIKTGERGTANEKASMSEIPLAAAS